MRRLWLALPLTLLVACTRPDSGQLVDVGTYSLYLNCQGTASGEPTVILEHGIGERASSESWIKVQAALVPSVRVCRYDRADVGKSGASGKASRSGSDLIRDLHTLLRNAKIPGPYVLAGHSFGGYPVRLYAHAYPREVVGMVLVEAAHEDMISEIPLGPEHLNLAQMGAEVRAAGNLGRLPLVVVTRGQDQSARWLGFQKRLVALSAVARQVIATDSGHEVPIRQPSVVVQAIRTVLDETKAK